MKEDHPDSDRLVPALRAGDPEALRLLQEEAKGLVLHGVRRYLKNESDVEEIVSDTYLRVYQKISKFRGDSSLCTWVRRIAENLAKNRWWYWQRRRADKTLSMDAPIGEDLTTTVGDMIPDERLETHPHETAELEQRIAAARGRLSVKYQEILRLLIDEHLEYVQISEATGITLGTVKSRIARARENLRRLLEEVPTAEVPKPVPVPTPTPIFAGFGSQLERRRVIIEHLAQGMTNSAINRATGAHTLTIAKVRKIYEITHGTVLCTCGKPVTHRGWCRPRYEARRLQKVA